MGTDIHFFAEKRNKATKQWEYLPAPPDGWNWEENQRCKELGIPYECHHSYRYQSERAIANGYERWDEGNDPESLTMRDWFNDRNYRLFAILAGVRNGRGFADCDTGDPIVPISEPRGWPDDLSPELEREREGIQHTPSWLTVAEILAYLEKHRDNPVVQRGVVSGPTYEKLKEGEVPQTSCGAIYGVDIITVTRQEYQALLPSLRYLDDPDPGHPLSEGPQAITPNGKRVYVRTEWVKPLGYFTGAFEKCLAELQEYGPAEDLRVVFYFDS